MSYVIESQVSRNVDEITYEDNEKVLQWSGYVGALVIDEVDDEDVDVGVGEEVEEVEVLEEDVEELEEEVEEVEEVDVDEVELEDIREETAEVPVEVPDVEDNPDPEGELL
ncbi:MAG: hypothetical protein Q9199_001143 [Rusavskia elegans]